MALSIDYVGCMIGTRWSWFSKRVNNRVSTWEMTNSNSRCVIFDVWTSQPATHKPSGHWGLAAHETWSNVYRRVTGSYRQAFAVCALRALLWMGTGQVRFQVPNVNLQKNCCDELRSCGFCFSPWTVTFLKLFILILSPAFTSPPHHSVCHVRFTSPSCMWQLRIWWFDRAFLLELSSLESFIISFLVLGTFAAAQLSEEELRHSAPHCFRKKTFRTRRVRGAKLASWRGLQNERFCWILPWVLAWFCLSWQSKRQGTLWTLGVRESGEKDFIHLEWGSYSQEMRRTLSWIVLFAHCCFLGQDLPESWASCNAFQPWFLRIRCGCGKRQNSKIYTATLNIRTLRSKGSCTHALQRKMILEEKAMITFAFLLPWGSVPSCERMWLQRTRAASKQHLRLRRLFLQDILERLKTSKHPERGCRCAA